MRIAPLITTHLARVAAALSALAALAACSSSPPVHFHSLMPIDTPARAAAAASAPPLAISVEPVRVPAQVDQPQWLVRLTDDSVARLEQERWASPLREELRAAVREWLIDRYGMNEALPAVPASAPIRIALDVRQFESVPGREARLEGSWILTRPAAGTARPEAASCDWLIREAAGAGYAALATAQRSAVARLADAIGTSVIAFDRGEPVSCPKRDQQPLTAP